MSDKPVAMFATMLIAAPLAVVCCAVGPATVFAIASGALAGTFTTLFGDISLPTTLILAAFAASTAPLVWNWWKKKKASPAVELEDL